ncbi:hypothetical protein A3781_15955 [Bacillus badius]|nr:hypothetical protein A3781_15955 [Bacillus badius]
MNSLIHFKFGNLKIYTLIIFMNYKLFLPTYQGAVRQLFLIFLADTAFIALLKRLEKITNIFCLFYIFVRLLFLFSLFFLFKKTSLKNRKENGCFFCRFLKRLFSYILFLI